MYISNGIPYGQIERIQELMTIKIDENGKQGITQEKLASAIGVDKSNVNKWFKKGVKIRTKNLSKIAEYLNCDLEFLTCKQPYPRKTTTQIKIPINKTDIYLHKLKDLMSTTNNSFDINYNISSNTYDVYKGYIVENDIKYPYECISQNYDGEESYTFTTNKGDNIVLTVQETQDFVNDILKYISYRLESIKK